MTEPEADRHTEIEALLAERRKFEAWLAQLDAKRESAASHVFERVHADYTKRLDTVRGQLRDKADTLRSLVADLETRLGKEQEKVTRKTDERAEAELRAMVGEFSESEWTSAKKKLDSSIADLRAKFDGTERELAELKDLLSNVTGTQAPARPSVMQAAAVTVLEDLGQAGEAHASPQSEPEVATAPPAAEAVEPDVGASAAAAPKAPPAAEEPAARPPTPFDELAFLRSVAGTPSRPSGNAAVSPEPAAEPPKVEPRSVAKASKSAPASEPETVVTAEPEPTPEPTLEEAPRDPTPAPPRASTPVAEQTPLGAPTPRTSQAIRSLKCQECGTLNFPTEWYCERCGGELAAF